MALCAVTPFLVSGAVRSPASAAPPTSPNANRQPSRIAAPSGDARRMLIAEAKTPDKNPAICGVRLLQLIFSNLRRSQLALGQQMKNNVKPLLLADAAPSSSVDPLYIRPVERQTQKASSSKADAFATDKLDRVDSRRVQQAALAGKDMKWAHQPGDNQYGSSAGGTVANLDGAEKIAEKQVAHAAAKKARLESFSGARNSSIAMSTPSSVPALPASPVTMNAPVAAPMNARASSAYNGLNPQYKAMSQENASRLANSINRLFNATSHMTELTDDSQASVKTYGAADRARSEQTNTKVIAKAPLIQEYPSSGVTMINAQQSMLQQNKFANAAPMVQTETSTLQGLATQDLAKESFRDEEKEKDAGQALQPNQPGLYKNFRSPLTALLPPNVVSGIPIARLGATSQELSRSVKAPVFKQKVDDWTVWTVPADGDNPAVQLFMRRSVVEAIRVFAQPYLGQEVGIRIGDNLPAIKQKFGEPELLLPEPDLTGRAAVSQNYIYPLSHVAFQLTRTKSHVQPQVVSVLIFDVQ